MFHRTSEHNDLESSKTAKQETEGGEEKRGGGGGVVCIRCDQGFGVGSGCPYKNLKSHSCCSKRCCEGKQSTLSAQHVKAHATFLHWARERSAKGVLK